MHHSLLLTMALALPVSAGEWKPLTTELLKEKHGFGGVCGVAVEPATGDLYISFSDRGVYRSTDQGKTWQRHGKEFKGRSELQGSLHFDPTHKTKRLLLSPIYNGPVLLGASNSEDWHAFDKKASHCDWCVVDWTDPEMKFVLALKHESGGLLFLSRDGGKSFTDVGKGYGTAWIFDSETAVATMPKSKERPTASLVRTTDGGKTWTPAGDHAPIGPPRWFGDSLYWLTPDSLIASRDKGATWTKLSDVKARIGPAFGKDAKHMFALANTGVLESTDGGATWSKPIPLPEGFKGVTPLSWIDYDPVHDVIYVMKMGSELFAMPRK